MIGRGNLPGKLRFAAGFAVKGRELQAFRRGHMRSLIAGNWKMNGLAAALPELAALRDGLGSPACDVLVCPPATLLSRAADVAAGRFHVGGQDCHAKPSGAFTGDVSAEMLKDAGASFVIVGHSERRQYHGESDGDVAAKAQAAWRAGLKAIVCIGETAVQREAGTHNHVCGGQIDGSVPQGATAQNTVLAYEPVWAIGTGKTPTSAEIAAMHAHIRSCLVARLGEGANGMLILYGGSVNPNNAAEILNLPEVGGALVGGASLKASDFLAIIAAVKQP
jgi:triosephosphate isomerase